MFYRKTTSGFFWLPLIAGALVFSSGNPTIAQTANCPVLGQTPQAVENCLGTPKRRNTKRFIYNAFAITQFLPQAGSLWVNFTSGYAQSITVSFGKDIPYGKKEASGFFNYIFGYAPTQWLLLSSTPTRDPSINFYDYCLATGVKTSFIGEQKRFVGGGGAIYANAAILKLEQRCK